MHDITALKTFTVLYVEDDPVVLKNMQEILACFFKTVYVCDNGLDAVDLYAEHLPDMLITDIQMTDFSGLELIQTLKERYFAKAYMAITSAHAEQALLLDALHSGVERYIIKPIAQQELMALFEDFLQKRHESQQLYMTIDDAFAFEKHTRTLMHDGQPIALNEKESKLLTLLCDDPTRIFSYEEIEYQVWGKRSMSLPALRSVVRDLRKKLGKAYICNVSKRGYRLHD